LESLVNVGRPIVAAAAFQAAGPLRDFLNFTVADAGSAGAQALMRSVHDSAHGLDIVVPAAVAHIMGVTDLMPELRTFAA
jgi:hypothetical protein